MPNSILVTGGEGQLARALVALDPLIDAPSRSQLDFSNYQEILAYCEGKLADIVIHAGAVTNKFDEMVDEEYIQSNIIGTSNVVLWCMRHGARLVYISSDYVYPGERGDYTEDSVLFPVNRYAKSKLGGEMAVQLYDNSLIIRTSFYNTLNFSQACTDQYTSRISLGEAAKAVYHLATLTELRGIVNVGTRSKRTVYEIVKSEFNPEVQTCTRKDFHLPYLLPPDSSLSTTRFYSMMHSDGQPSKSQNACRVCGSSRLVQYLHLGVTPLANSYLAEQDLPAKEFKEELALQLCGECSLSQLSKVVNPDRMFKHYLYVSSTTTTFQKHCIELASTSIAAVRASAGDWVLDIASNDGCLLSKFRDLGMNVVGVDPAENLAREANAAGIRTLCGYWSRAMAQDLVSRFAPPKIVTATNVIAHVDDVHGFVGAVASCLAPRGVFVVECPYAVDFIEKNEFDTAYHEHLSYFSVHALSLLMERHGLQIWDVEYFEDLHGGTIRVMASRVHDYPVSQKVASFLTRELEFGIKDLARYETFAKRIVQNKQKLVTLLNKLNGAGKTIWAYGASAKGNTLMNYFGISHDLVPVVIDDNPKKWGLYTPGAHMRIVGIHELAKAEVDYLLLLAWNFKSEIMERCRKASYPGGFIVPVPEVQTIEKS